jgi:hypothetical protein
MMRSLFRQSAGLLVGGLLVSIVLLITARFNATAQATVASVQQPIVVNANLAATQVLHYQGRLLDPATNQPKNDGAYQMLFSIYNVNTGGAPLWSETKSVSVSNGLFTTLLGDTAPLDLSIFNGQDLWLGITVGADPETAPRQRMAHVPYAVRAENAGNADKVDGMDAAAFAPAVHTHTGADIVDGSLSAADLGINAVDTTKIADNSITAADIQDHSRTIGFPANALNFDKTSTIITQAATGLRWQASFSNAAYLTLPQPVDWDGVSDVILRLYFITTTSTPGNVSFFIRPRAYNPGDIFMDVSSINASPVPVAQTSVVEEQVFTIPAARFGAKRLWVITIQNQGSGSTYPDDVVVMAVELSYTASQ